MFRAVPLIIIKSFSLYTEQWYMSYRFADSLRAGSGQNQFRPDPSLVPSWSYSQAVSKPVWHIPLLCVQWKALDDGQRNCPKYVEFYSKNKFEKLVHLVGFIVRTRMCTHTHHTHTHHTHIHKYTTHTHTPHTHTPHTHTHKHTTHTHTHVLFTMWSAFRTKEIKIWESSECRVPFWVLGPPFKEIFNRYLKQIRE